MSSSLPRPRSQSRISTLGELRHKREDNSNISRRLTETCSGSVQYSSLTGLLLILQLPEGLEPLLSTGQSKDIPSLYNRYVNTITHVNSWYEDDIFNPETKGYKSIRQVRGMHRRLQTAMNDKFKVQDADGKPRLWFTQYDVALTQFAFIGLAMLYPEKTAMIGAKSEDLENINYYWRVLGYLMGIEDEFNACQFETYPEIREFFRLIFEREYKDSFAKLPCQKGLEMSQSICVALHYFTPLLTFNNLAHWWNEQFQFNGYQPQPMTTHQKILHFWTKISFNHLLKSTTFMKLSNKLHKKKFERKLKNKDKVYEKLKEQYKDNTKLVYYSDRVDYFSAKPKSNDSNNNNNNNDETILEKSNQSGCPFGFRSFEQPAEKTLVAA